MYLLVERDLLERCGSYEFSFFFFAFSDFPDLPPEDTIMGP